LSLVSQKDYPTDFRICKTGRLFIAYYKKIDPDCREGVRAQLERMKELCKERNNLYKKQNDLKGQKQKLEKSLER
ncbi:hypothetical protein D3Z62_31560, partial [Lachnospiraceae bacterium]|nr:hypothetical protein [Lachnospiraceae bacterium]